MPKRSTGCDLCRKRKVRCDEAKPFCQRCEAFGEQCPGYRRISTIVFKDQTQTVTDRSQLRQFSNTNSSQDKKAWDSSGSKDVRALSKLRVAYAQSRSPSSSPCDIDTAPAIRANLVATFHDVFVPVSAASSKEQLAHWIYIRMLISINPEQRALRSALDAVTVGFLATQHSSTQYRSKQLSYQAKKLCGRTIVDLSSALADPRTRTLDETIAAVSIFANCDFFGDTALHLSAWIWHVLGVRELLVLRGSSSINTPLIWKIFLNNRLQSSIGGILFRKSVQYDRSNWLAITADAAKSNAFISLTDILVHIPTLMEDLDHILDDLGGMEVKGLSSILHRCIELLECLESWYARLSSSEGDDLIQEVDVQRMPDFLELSPDVPFSTAMSFSSVAIGFLMILYFASRFHLYRIALEILQSPLWKFADLEDIRSVVPNVPSEENAQNQLDKHALLLTRAIPFLYTKPCGIIGRIQNTSYVWFAQNHFGSRIESFDSGLSEAVRHEFSLLHAWCWKMFAVLDKLKIVVNAYELPTRSNTNGRVRTIVPEEDAKCAGMNTNRMARELGVDLHAPLDKIESAFSLEYLLGR